MAETCCQRRARRNQEKRELRKLDELRELRELDELHERYDREAKLRDELRLRHVLGTKKTEMQIDGEKRAKASKPTPNRKFSDVPKIFLEKTRNRS